MNLKDSKEGYIREFGGRISFLSRVTFHSNPLNMSTVWWLACNISIGQKWCKAEAGHRKIDGSLHIPIPYCLESGYHFLRTSNRQKGRFLSRKWVLSASQKRRFFCQLLPVTSEKYISSLHVTTALADTFPEVLLVP